MDLVGGLVVVRDGPSREVLGLIRAPSQLFKMNLTHLNLFVDRTLRRRIEDEKE